MSQKEAFPALYGDGKKKTTSKGLVNPPPECGPPLEAGYLVRDPTEQFPSISESYFLKEKNAPVQDTGKRVAKAKA